MTAKEANFTIKFNGDTGALVQDLQKLKGVIDKLDLTSTMKANFSKIFGDLEKNLGKIGEGFAGGLKDNRSIATFEQSLERTGVLIERLKNNINSIPEDTIRKAFNADPEQLRAYVARIDELNDKIKNESVAAFENLKDQLTSLGKETKASAFQDFIKHLSTGEIDEAVRDFQKLNTILDRVKKGTPRREVWEQTLSAIKNEFDGLIPSVTKSQEEIGELNGKIEDLGDEAGTKGVQGIANAVQSLGDLNQQLQDTGKNCVETAKDSNSLQKELDGFKNKVVYFFGLNNAVRLFQRALRSAFETVKDLDKVMTETAVVTDFSVGDMWTQLPEYTQRANELGVSIHDVYEASTLYYQQGLKTNEVMAVTNATLKMARIAGLEASEATDRMTNALRGFNMEITEANANNIADVYSKLAAITASDVDEISTAMTKTASLAASANMSFENTAAFLAQIIETTRESAETAGTALKTVIARFSEVKKLYSEGELLGTDAEGEAIDINKVSAALRIAGIDMNEFLTGAKGLDEVFIELASKWNSLTLVQQRYIATMAAGSRQQSRFIALMSDYQRTMQLTGAANNAAGASTKQYEKTLESFQTKLERLKNAYNEFVLGIANSSVIKAGIDLLTGILTKLNELTKGATEAGTSFKKLMLSIGLFSGAKAVLKGFEKNILGNIAQAFGKEGQNSGKSFIDGLKDSLWKAKSVFKKDFWLGGLNDAGSIKTTIEYTQKLTEALNSQNEMATALGMTKKNIQLLEQAGIPLSEQAILLQNARAHSIMISTEALDVETIEKIKNLQAELAEQGVIQKGIVLKMAEKSQRLLNAIGIDTEKNKLFQLILAKIKENQVLKENIALQMASMGYLTVILAIIIAIIAAITTLYIVVKRGKAAFRLDKIKTDLDEINKLLEDSKTKLDSLSSAADDLQSLNDGFDNLKKGTVEWTEQLVKANQKVIDLVNDNNELGQFITLGEHGQLTITAEGLETLVKTQTDEIIALQREALNKTNELTLEEVRAKINSIITAAGFGKSGTEWGHGREGQQRRERRQYGGLTFDEFYHVAARLQQQGVTGTKSAGDTEAINDAEKAIIRQTLSEFGLTDATDQFIDRLQEIGIVFDQVASEAQKLKATQLGAVFGQAGEVTDVEESIISLFQEQIAEKISQIELPERMGQIDKATLQKMGFQFDEQLGGTVVKWIDENGKEVSQNLLDFYKNALSDFPKQYQAMFKSLKIDEIFASYKSVAENLSLPEQKILTGDLSLRRADINKTPYIDDAILREISLMGINPDPIIQQFQKQQQKMSTVFSNISNWLPDDVVDKLTYGTVQVIQKGLAQVPTGLRQKYFDQITSFLDSANLNDEQYNNAMQYLISGNFDAFKEYLTEIGKDIPSSKLTEFCVQLGALNKQFGTNTIVQLNNRFKEFEGTMTKLAEGTHDFDGEEYQQLVANGLNTNDFISTGEGKYRYTGDTETAASILATNLFQEASSALQTMETSPHGVAGIGMVGYTEEEIAPVRERIRTSSQQYGYLGIETSGDQGVDLEAYDEGLIERIKEDYPQLIGLVDELTKAQDKEEKASLRAAARLAIKNEKARESFKNLTSAIQDNLEVLKKEYRGTDEYAEALENITQYAKEAFSQDITSDFIDQNLDLFIDFANGVEGSTRKIQDALLDTVTDTGLNVDVIRTAIESLDQAEFDIYGQADFGPIFKALDEAAAASGNLAAYLTTLEGLGFKIEYTYDKDGNINGGKIVNIGEQQRQRNFRSYGGGGSKSSGGGGSKDPVLTAYDELYNLVQQINTTLREREKLEKDYERMVEREGQSVEAIKQKHLDILAALQKERDQESQLLAGRRQQAASILNEQYLDNGVFKTYGQMGMSKYGSINTTTGEITLDIGLINSITDADEKARVDAYIQRLEYYGDEIKSGLDTLEDLSDKIYEEQQRGKQDYLELEERTYQALVNQQQKVIDGYKDLSDAITDANQQIISSLRESVEMERQIRDNTKKEEDIADKEARLAYLRRDTSGANDTEIMKLEKELGEAREQYADSLVDQAIADLEDQNTKASEQRQKQIDLMQKQLDYAAKSGEFWDETYRLIQTAMKPDGTLDFSSDLVKLLQADDFTAGMSQFGKEQWMKDMASQYASAMVGLENWKAVDLVPTGEAVTRLDDLVTTTERISTQTGEGSSGGSGGGGGGSGSSSPTAEEKKQRKEQEKKEAGGTDWGRYTKAGFSIPVNETEAKRYINSLDDSEIADLAALLGLPIGFINSDHIKDIIDAAKKAGFAKYASGGLVTSTGPAWLDGSLSSPEMVLNAKDTANLIQLKSILAQILSGGMIPGGGGDNYYNIDINVDELASDYDVDKIAARIKQKIYDDSIYRNVNAINYIR